MSRELNVYDLIEELEAHGYELQQLSPREIRKILKELGYSVPNKDAAEIKQVAKSRKTY